MTITGSHFSGATRVEFGGRAGSDLRVLNDHTIVVTTPPGGSGSVDVRVSGQWDTSAMSKSDRFTYAAVPVVTGLSPSSGPSAGNTVVTVTGRNFNPSSVIRLDGVPAVTTFVSSTILRATVHPALPDQGNVSVSVANTPSVWSQALVFTYVHASGIGTVPPRNSPARNSAATGPHGSVPTTGPPGSVPTTGLPQQSGSLPTR